MRLGVLFALGLFVPRVAAGEDAAPIEARRADSDAGLGRAHAMSVAARAGTPGYGGVVGYRFRSRPGISLGVEFAGLYAPEAFIGGFAVDDNAIYSARIPLLFPVYRSRRLTMALTLAPGVRGSRSFDDAAAHRQGVSATLDVGAMAYLWLHQRLTLQVGVDNAVSVQVVPIRDVDKLATLLVVGPVVPINDRLSWFALVEAGGAFGSGGDAGKFLIRGTSGVRVMFGTSAHRWRAF